MTYVYYNLTNITNQGNSTTMLTFVQGVNDVMKGIPSLLIITAIGLVLLIILIRQTQDALKSFAATSFVMLIIALISYPMRLLSGKALIIIAVLCPLSIALLWVFGVKDYG